MTTSSDPNNTSPQLSQQGIALYKRILEDTVFIKKQQWATTNYAALIYVAIVWLGQHTSMPSSLFKCALSAVAIATGAMATALLMKFQCDLGKLRIRIQAANEYAFRGDEKSGLGLKDREENPFTRGGHILAALIAVAIVGAFLTVGAMFYPKAD